MTQYEKWWMPQLINCISSGLNIKRQTTTEKENPPIGSAVWRGIIENAFLSFIQILCQPSQPDLKGFSIKSWTWQVMAIYSTHTHTKKFNQGLLAHSRWTEHSSKTMRRSWLSLWFISIFILKEKITFEATVYWQTSKSRDRRLVELSLLFPPAVLVLLSLS